MITLHEDEKIILQKRRHWYVIATESFVLAIAVVAPIGTLIFIAMNNDIRHVLAGYFALIIFILSTWLLLVWILFFIFFTNYYLDVLVVTNMRIVDIEQHGLFARDIVEVRLKNVQDIKIEVFGILASILNFGDLHIQTAGASREVVIRKIAHPYQVQKIISANLHKSTNHTS